MVQLEVIDRQSSAAYAWIAIGRLSPSLARIVDLRKVASYQRVGADLANGASAGRTLARRLATLGADPSVRSLGVTRLAELRSDASALVPFAKRTKDIGWPVSEIDKEKRRFVRAMLDNDSKGLDEITQAWLKRMPQTTQHEIGAQWITTPTGRERLLHLIQQGVVSAQLVHSAEIRPTLLNDKRPQLQRTLANIDGTVSG